LHARLLTLALLGAVGQVLAVSVLLTSLLVDFQDIGERLSPRQLERYPILLSVGTLGSQIIFGAVSLLVTFAVFSMVYRFMPNAFVTFRDTVPGALIGSLLW